MVIRIYPWNIWRVRKNWTEVYCCWIILYNVKWRSSPTWTVVAVAWLSLLQVSRAICSTVLRFGVCARSCPVLRPTTTRHAARAPDTPVRESSINWNTTRENVHTDKCGLYFFSSAPKCSLLSDEASHYVHECFLESQKIIVWWYLSCFEW
jgi:hypothetical protein